MSYKRVLLKLSGESLMGEKQGGIDPERLGSYCAEIKTITGRGVQLGIVVGGGNIFRGLQGAANGFDRVQGDYMGMLATVINSLAIQAELKKQGVAVKLMSGLAVESVADAVDVKEAISLLEKGLVVIFSGGTGNPYFTTDTASALRALEIKADVLLKGTRVDGIYSDDPEKNSSAVKYDTLTFEEAYTKQLKIMDMTAFTLCQENKLPIHVFDMNTKGNLVKVISGEKTGSVVS